MKHFQKFQPFNEESLEIPRLGMQIVETNCFHCHQLTRHPVPATFVDWEVVAEKYRQGYEDLVKRFDRIIKDLDVMHGSNPIMDYVANEWKMVLGDIKSDFGGK